MADMKALAKILGRNHELAGALWETGWYEARTAAAFVDEPGRVTPEQMDRWCADFDNWGICDTVCFHLFDRTPHAWAKVEVWGDAPEEFVRRAAFALLASLALHDRKAGAESFVRFLPLVERAAADERNFVKKGVSWALRARPARRRAERGGGGRGASTGGVSGRCGAVGGEGNAPGADGCRGGSAARVASREGVRGAAAQANGTESSTNTHDTRSATHHDAVRA